FTTGMLLTPAPARPTAFNFGGISRSCILAERTRMASGFFMSLPTRYRSAGRRSRPSAEMLFNVRISYTALSFLGGELLHVVEHRRRFWRDVPEQIVADDRDRQSRRAEILLRAGVDQPETLDVERTRQKRRRRVGDERHVAGIGDRMKLDAADRLVRGVMHIG